MHLYCDQEHVILQKQSSCCSSFLYPPRKIESFQVVYRRTIPITHLFVVVIRFGVVPIVVDQSQHLHGT